MSKELKEFLANESFVIGTLGAIGSGKSTFSKALADNLEVARIEENFPLNPFLADFYKDQVDYSFKSQLWFLKSTVDQMMNTPEFHTGSAVILDPANEMNFIFAQTHKDMGWMDEREFEVYSELYKILSEKSGVKKPDLYIAMSAGADLLMSRIVTRGRGFEVGMLRNNPKYLVKLNENIARFAAGKKNVLFIDSEHNYQNPDSLQRVMFTIGEKIKSF